MISPHHCATGTAWFSTVGIPANSNAFRDRTKTVRLHPGTGVHLHPGSLFGNHPGSVGGIPESRSRPPRNHFGCSSRRLPGVRRRESSLALLEDLREGEPSYGALRLDWDCKWRGLRPNQLVLQLLSKLRS